MRAHFLETYEVRLNLHHTVKEVQQLEAIPNTVEKIQELLKEPASEAPKKKQLILSGIFEAYMHMRHLETLQQTALEQSKMHPELSQVTDCVIEINYTKILLGMFTDISSLKQQFEDKLFENIGDALNLAKKTPHALVRALQVLPP